MQHFQQLQWGKQLEEACRAIVRLAIAEDLSCQSDWTTISLIDEEQQGAAQIVAREEGIAAGMPAIDVVIDEFSADIVSESTVQDGAAFGAGDALATLQGNSRDLLTCERTLLNLLSRLMGIATLTRKYVDKLQGLKAQVYDTRKTTPGWRLLEKYAVQCGGARNHRTGLFDAILIKDNHLALGTPGTTKVAIAASDAVKRTHRFIRDSVSEKSLEHLPVEVEVDNLQQLAAVLSAEPDIVLLDNMSLEDLREAVRLRDELAPQVALEASGGVRLETLREIAATGVEQISVGALTHSARSLDIGLDWLTGKRVED